MSPPNIFIIVVIFYYNKLWRYLFKIIYGLVHVLEHYCTVVLQWRLSTLFRALLMHLSAVLVLKLMATIVSTFIFDSSFSKTLLPWTIYMLEDDRITVQAYYEMVVSKQPADVQDHLSDHILDQVWVGNTKNELDKVGNTGIGALIFLYACKSKSSYECGCWYIS